MTEAEQIAREFQQIDPKQLAQEVNQKWGEKGMLPPKKPGILICSLCHQPITIEDAKQIKEEQGVRELQRCLDWQVHYRCKQKALQICDQSTPGLCAERERNRIE